MTVNELIEKLKEFNGSEEVTIDIEHEIEYDDGYFSKEVNWVVDNVIPDIKKNTVKLTYF